MKGTEEREVVPEPGQETGSGGTQGPSVEAKGRTSAKSGADQKRRGSRKKSRRKEKGEPLEHRILRLQADFENFRKRTLREKDEIYRRANSDLMLELLPVLDHMDLALKAAGDHGADDAFAEGFRLVSEQFLSALAKFGLEPIDTDEKQFDPNVHEAVSHLPSDEVPDGFIIARTRGGYLLGSRLLRAAQVVVSSGPVPAEDGRN